MWLRATCNEGNKQELHLYPAPGYDDFLRQDLGQGDVTRSHRQHTPALIPRARAPV
jgi:hypothetical protein